MERNRTEYLEIDFRRLGRALMRRGWRIGLVTVLCALLALGAAVFLVTPRYQSCVLFYASNTPENAGDGVSSGDLTASEELVDTFDAILYSRETLEAVIRQTGLALNYEELSRIIDTRPVGNTQLFEVLVTAADSRQAKQLADAVASVLPRRVEEITRSCRAFVVDRPAENRKASSPDQLRWSLIGAALGLLMAVAAVLAEAFWDDTIRNRDEVEDLPVLATVTGNPETDREAFRLLRVKLNHCAAWETQSSRVMGITGIGTTNAIAESAAALADSLARTGRRVLLVECDMDQSGVAHAQKIEMGQGLFPYLEGKNRLRGSFRKQSVGHGKGQFYVLTAGKASDDPVELLGSVLMTSMVKAMRRIFDDVILVLPDGGSSCGALEVSQLVDGYLLLVEQNKTGRKALEETLAGLDSVKAQVLGMLYLIPARKTK